MDKGWSKNIYHNLKDKQTQKVLTGEESSVSGE